MMNVGSRSNSNVAPSDKSSAVRPGNADGGSIDVITVTSQFNSCGAHDHSWLSLPDETLPHMKLVRSDTGERRSSPPMSTCVLLPSLVPGAIALARRNRPCEPRTISVASVGAYLRVTSSNSTFSLSASYGDHSRLSSSVSASTWRLCSTFLSWVWHKAVAKSQLHKRSSNTHGTEDMRVCKIGSNTML
jgi:hypothetical protein